MPRSSRQDSSSIIPSQHVAQSFVITSCISQVNFRITAFLAFSLAIRSQRSNSRSLPQCESFRVFSAILRCLIFNTSSWWSVFIHFWKVSKVNRSRYRVFVTCFTSSKQTPFFPHLHLPAHCSYPTFDLFFPPSLKLFFSSTLNLFFHILLILMLRPRCRGAQVIFTFQYQTSLPSRSTLSKSPLKKASSQSGVLLQS